MSLSRLLGKKLAFPDFSVLGLRSEELIELLRQTHDIEICMPQVMISVLNQWKSLRRGDRDPVRDSAIRWSRYLEEIRLLSRFIGQTFREYTRLIGTIPNNVHRMICARSILIGFFIALAREKINFVVYFCEEEFGAMLTENGIPCQIIGNLLTRANVDAELGRIEVRPETYINRGDNQEMETLLGNRQINEILDTSTLMTRQGRENASRLMRETSKWRRDHGILILQIARNELNHHVEVGSRHNASVEQRLKSIRAQQALSWIEDEKRRHPIYIFDQGNWSSAHERITVMDMDGQNGNNANGGPPTIQQQIINGNNNVSEQEAERLAGIARAIMAANNEAEVNMNVGEDTLTIIKLIEQRGVTARSSDGRTPLLGEHSRMLQRLVLGSFSAHNDAREDAVHSFLRSLHLGLLKHSHNASNQRYQRTASCI